MKDGAITKYEERELRERAVNAAKKLRKKHNGKPIYKVKLPHGEVETTNPDKWAHYRFDGVNIGWADFSMW